MNLQEIKTKLDKARDDRARTDERLALLNRQKKELEKEMEKYGVKTISDIEDKELKLKEELDTIVKNLESLESNILLDKFEKEDEEGDPEEKKIIDEIVGEDDVLKGLI